MTRVLESPSHDAYFNMALEEYIFEELPTSDSYFMLWQNRRAVVVGRYQNTLEEINPAYIREEGVDVVRRLSGGGAMYQDLGNLNFTFVVDQRDAKALDFGRFIDPVVRALASFGVKAEKSGRNDILIEGKKFSGNAQYNRKNRTMHHGTLLFDADLSAVGKALKVSRDKIQSKGIQSVRSRVVNLKDYLDRSVTLEDFKASLLGQMFGENAPRYTLTQKDLEAVDALRTHKYATWEWNFGNSPAHHIQKRRRFSFGEVQAAIDVRDGIIRDILLTGDFFGNGEIELLLDRLRGTSLQEDALVAAIGDFDVENVISGMQKRSLIDLLLY